MIRSLFYPFVLVMFVSLAQAQAPLHHNLFPLSDVELLDGPFKTSMERNIEHLLEYDVDRLLEPFLTEAGITPKGTRYTNWDGLAGHVGGHYLSALAIHYAASGNEACKSRMEYMIAELKACQDKNGDGYLGGIPNGKAVWSGVLNGNLTAYNNAWVPWYNLHKTYAGLRDAWVYGGNETAKQMFLKLCNWGTYTISNLSASQMQAMLDIEFGGMNEVYAHAYKIFGDAQFLEAAKAFTHDVMFDSFERNQDNLDNKHANTQIPKFVGFASVGEYDDASANYMTTASNFWNKVIDRRTLALGGNSRREFFPAASDSHDYVEDREGPETCNTYNMLKLSAQLHGETPNVKYADYYENALFNHILSSQHPEHGGYVYFTPLRPMHYRVYSAPNQAMWCCVGTGMENHGKHGEFIYSHNGDELYVNLFISSKLNWEEKGIQITQTTNFPNENTTTLTIEGSGLIDFKLRYPGWVKEGELEIKINDGPFPTLAKPGEYISLKKTWASGDKIELKMPMHLTYEEMPNVNEYKALKYGPILLGAKTSTNDMAGLVADAGRWSHIAAGGLVGSFNAPVLVSQTDSLVEKIVTVDAQKLQFSASELLEGQDQFQDLVLEPFYQIHDSRYMMYWLTLSASEAETYLESLKEEERARLILDARTIDHVSTGEQQPEVDHKFVSSNSFSGIHENEYWRDARDGGYFEYELATGGRTDISLWVRYWGNETGSRQFDVKMDDLTLARENIVGKWNRNDFVDVEYPLDSAMIADKEFVKIRFQALPGSVAGGVFYVRIVKNTLSENASLSEISLNGELLAGFQSDKLNYTINELTGNRPEVTVTTSDPNASFEIGEMDESGILKIVVTAENYTNTQTYELDFSAAILGNAQIDELVLFPNPAENWITVPSAEQGATATIYDLTGKELMAAFKLEGKINIASLESGTYILRIESSDLTRAIRFVKR